MATKSTINVDHPVLEQLRMLAALGDHGMITTHEFNAKKADLLSTADLLSKGASDRLPAHPDQAGPPPKAA